MGAKKPREIVGVALLVKSVRIIVIGFEECVLFYHTLFRAYAILSSRCKIVRLIFNVVK